MAPASSFAPERAEGEEGGYGRAAARSTSARRGYRDSTNRLVLLTFGPLISAT